MIKTVVISIYILIISNNIEVQVYGVVKRNLIVIRIDVHVVLIYNTIWKYLIVREMNVVNNSMMSFYHHQI